MSLNTYVARHAQTLVGSLGRIVQHPVATLMTMGVVAIALALPLLLQVLLQNARVVAGNWNQAFDVTVYMAPKAGTSRTQALAKQIRARDDVADVHVIPADEALLQFKKTSGFGQALDALGENPLPDALVVTPTPAAGTPAGTDALRIAIAALPDVQTVQVDSDWVRRLNAILDIARRVVLLTAALLALGVVLVVGNTIRLDVMNRRAEIEVTKLVGGSDGFARRPFLYSGLWYGFGGGILAILLIELAVLALRGPAGRLAALYGSNFRLAGLSIFTASVVLVAAVFLSWLGSWVAATRHIRGIEPT